jgi:hypothetical protein
VIVQCPHCHKPVVVSGLGRRPLNITVKNIYDTLQDCKSIALAAEKLGCSRAYIYKVLKCEGLSLTNILQ